MKTRSESTFNLQIVRYLRSKESSSTIKALGEITTRYNHSVFPLLVSLSIFFFLQASYS